jgi:hypothetical protein
VVDFFSAGAGRRGSEMAADSATMMTMIMMKKKSTLMPATKFPLTLLSFLFLFLTKS